MSLTGAISRAFLHGLNDVQTEGLPQFLEVLDKRRAEVPQRGLITGTATKPHFFMYPSTNETMADCFSCRLQSQTTLAS
ncbi:acyltransferase [Colletotrichum tabaci]|uniref:Acyltransferase n=1 Tax=Colletotrichum tabaci TaxID=1209068 RepID=A0AAV9SZC3_9PEZI